MSPLRCLAVSWLILAGLLLSGPRFAGASGLAARDLYPLDEIETVRISPGGEWVVAAARHGATHGLLAQRLGRPVSGIVQASRYPVVDIHWVGQDTLIAQFGSGRERRFLRADFKRIVGGRFEFSTSWFIIPGNLVDAVPLAEDELIWEFDVGGRNSVHRMKLDELMKYNPYVGSRRASSAGERLGQINGTSHRWIVDRAGTPRVALRRDDNGYSLLFRSSAKDDFEEVWSYKDDSPELMWPVSLTPDEQNILVKAYAGTDTIGLYEFDPVSASIVSEVYRRDDADLDSILLDPVTGDVLSVTFDLGSETRHHFLESSRALYQSLLETTEHEIDHIRVEGSSADRQQFIYLVSSVNEPGAHYLRDVPTGRSFLVGQWGAQLDRTLLTPIESFRVDSTDGISIEALLTIPDGAMSAPVPLLVMPHGGPIGVHDSKQFDPMVQYFASWGYAVLQANYRGSSGYGDDFQAAGRKQWAKGIEDDISAAVRATVARPDIDGSRVCIIGGSYGGFSAIASVLREKARYQCAVTINGVSDVPLMAESSDMADSRRAMKRYSELIGDPESERQRLLDISPTYHLQAIDVPVIVVYGDRDRRVDQDHAHRLLAMLQLYGKESHEIHVKGGHHSFDRDQWAETLPKIRRILASILKPNVVFEGDPERTEATETPSD